MNLRKSKGILWFSTKTMFLLLVLFSSIGVFLYLNTNIFYNEITLEPVTIYSSTSEAIKIDILINNQSSTASKQKYPIKNVQFYIKEPFNSEWSDFKILFENIEVEVSFWDKQNGYEEYNRSRSQEYVKTHIPDYLINASFIKNSFIPVWSQIWIQQPTISVITESFLKKKSYGEWEGIYFFNDKFSGTNLNEEFYLKADVEKLIFNIFISDNYEVVNFLDFNIDRLSDGYSVTKILEPGETIDLVVINENMIQFKKIAIWLSGSLILLVIGVFLRKWYQR